MLIYIFDGWLWVMMTVAANCRTGIKCHNYKAPQQAHGRPAEPMKLEC